MSSIKYIFTSDRLGFRSWTTQDIPNMAELCADPDVMEFFPPISDANYASDFVQRMQDQYAQNNYCFFAVELLENKQFIGFIGVSEIKYPESFTPSVEIGWRLAKNAWNKGYATEGAKRCLEYAFDNLDLPVIHSIAPVINKKSQRVMEKIGMIYKDKFIHPYLLKDERLKVCVVYEKARPNSPSI